MFAKEVIRRHLQDKPRLWVEQFSDGDKVRVEDEGEHRETRLIQTHWSRRLLSAVAVTKYVIKAT